MNPSDTLNPRIANVLSADVHRDLVRGERDIVFFAWHYLGIKLHPGQIRFLRGADGIVNILVPGNRYGKTVLLAVRHLWHCFYKIGLFKGDGDAWASAEYKTAALAPSSEVLEVMHKTIKAIMTSSFVVSREGEPIQTNFCRISWYYVPERSHNTAPFLSQFRDNTFIKYHSSSDDKFSSVQGKKYGYGGYDEGGRSHHLEYELKSNLIPRFQELGAPLDLASTPDQRSPSLVYHHEIFQLGLRGEQGFRSFEGSARENVYLTETYFRGIELSLGDDPLKAQVLDGKFVFGGDTLYKLEDIQRATTKDLNGGEGWWPGRRYVIATDTAISSDEQVDLVLDVPIDFDIANPQTKPLRLVRLKAFKGSTKSPQVAMLEHQELWDAYDKERAVTGILETFNEGSIRWYHDLPHHIKTKTKCYGSFQPPAAKKAALKTSRPTTNGGKKVDMLIALRKCLSAGVLQIPEDNKELIQQLIMYREDDDNLRTDRVISLALACWLVLEGKPANPIARAIPLNW